MVQEFLPLNYTPMSDSAGIALPDMFRQVVCMNEAFATGFDYTAASLTKLHFCVNELFTRDLSHERPFLF